MSYNSHKRKALDESKPMQHRASHIRSCAVCVCEKFKIKRSVVIDNIQKITGIDINEVNSSEAIIIAMGALDKIRLKDEVSHDT